MLPAATYRDTVYHMAREQRFILMGFDFLDNAIRPTEAPAALWTSKASRTERLKYYVPLLLGGFYFSPSVDVLILPDWQLLPTWRDLYRPSMRDAIEMLLGGIGDNVVRMLWRLIVPMGSGMWENDYQDAIMLLRRFKNLEEVIICNNMHKAESHLCRMRTAVERLLLLEDDDLTDAQRAWEQRLTIMWREGKQYNCPNVSTGSFLSYVRMD